MNAAKASDSPYTLPASADSPKVKYVRRFGYFAGWLAVLLLLAIFFMILLIPDDKFLDYDRIRIAGAVMYLILFALMVLFVPSITAGKGCPMVLNLVYGFNIVISAALGYFFAHIEFNGTRSLDNFFETSKDYLGTLSKNSTDADKVKVVDMVLEVLKYKFSFAQCFAFSFGVFVLAFVVTVPVRLVLGMADEGNFTFLRYFKPWRIAPEEDRSV